jgi:hypothetical protein
MPSARALSWSEIAVLDPTTVTSARRDPWARLWATTRDTRGPGIRIRTAVAATKAM